MLKLLLTLLALVSLQGRSALASESPYELIRLPDGNGHLTKWPAPDGSLALGRGAELTWAVATRPFRAGLPYGECAGLQPLSLLLDHHRLRESEFLREVEAGLAFWEKAANVRFRRIEDQEKASFVIGLSDEDDASMHARVSIGTGALKGDLLPLNRAIICLDRDELWTLKDRHAVELERISLSLRLLIAHEAGHVIGLDHADHRGQLMHHSVKDETLGLGAGDLEGARVLYGSPQL